MYYYTELVGDARELPTILASPDFNGSWVLDADPTKADGSDWYINQGEWFFSVYLFMMLTRCIQIRSIVASVTWSLTFEI